MSRVNISSLIWDHNIVVNSLGLPLILMNEKCVTLMLIDVSLKTDDTLPIPSPVCDILVITHKYVSVMSII